MRTRLRVSALPVAAAALYLTFAGSALAGTASISGTVSNGGCDAARPVAVSGPSRIEIEVSSTSASNDVTGEILAPDGRVVATGSYDTSGGGNYAVRVCSSGSSMNAPELQYSGLIGTGPSGQPVLQGPRQPQPATDNGGVLGVTATLTTKTVSGKGAIMTRAGLAWFTLNTVNGSTTLRVSDPVHHTVRLVKGVQAASGSGMVRLTGNGMSFVLRQSTTGSRIAFSSSRFTASGKVVRGQFHISA
jgi:hypothetical protein